VSRFLSSRARLKTPLMAILRRFSEQRLPAVIFGGALRDLMVHGPTTEPRDVDVVVDGASVEELTRLFQDVVDVWPLSDTWALRSLGTGCGDFRDLTLTTFLNVEAVVVELTKQPQAGRLVYSSGFFEAIRTRILDINLEENPFPELSAIRTLVTASSLDYGLSKRLARYVVHHMNRVPLECFGQIQFSHYGRVKLDTETLHAWVKIIHGQMVTQSVIRVPTVPTQLPLWKEHPVSAEAA